MHLNEDSWINNLVTRYSDDTNKQVHLCPNCFHLILRAEKWSHLNCFYWNKSFWGICKKEYQLDHFNPYSVNFCSNFKINNKSRNDSVVCFKEEFQKGKCIVKFIMLLLAILLAPMLSLLVLPVVTYFYAYKTITRSSDPYYQHSKNKFRRNCKWKILGLIWGVVLMTLWLFAFR